jgi:hypothetical protein
VTIVGRDLALLAAEYDADVLARESVPELACQLLADGFDSPSLRVAAGLLAGELDHARRILGRALEELGCEVSRDHRGQGAPLAREYAARGLDRRMPLARAISSIAALSLERESEPWALQGQALTRFELLSALWDDKPADRSEIEAEMRAELTALLDRIGVAYEP